MIDSLPRVLAGRYRLDRMIERGGMGIVYEGLQLDLGRRVAVKVLDLVRCPDAVSRERFAREASLAARLRSPHVVQVTDFVAGDGTEPPFLVMELLSGMPLSKVLHAERALAPARAVNITLQLLHVLAEAHAAGMIHRDVKPGNMFLVATHQREDFVKLLDFGIARLLEGRPLTAEGTRQGTLAFMAPEQAEGREVHARADVYAASAVLYTMLTGQHVIAARSFEELVSALRTSAPAPPSSLVMGIDPALDAIVLRGLARHPDQRHPSANDLAHALRGWLGMAAPAAAGPSMHPPHPTTSSFGPPPPMYAPALPTERTPAPPSGGRTALVVLAIVIGLLVVLGGPAAYFLMRRTAPAVVATPPSAAPPSAAPPSAAPPLATVTASASAIPSVAPVTPSARKPVDAGAPRADGGAPARLAYKLDIFDTAELSAAALEPKLADPIDGCMQDPRFDAAHNAFGQLFVSVANDGRVEGARYLFNGKVDPAHDRARFDALGACFKSRLRGLVLAGRLTAANGVTFWLRVRMR